MSLLVLALGCSGAEPDGSPAAGGTGGGSGGAAGASAAGSGGAAPVVPDPPSAMVQDCSAGCEPLLVAAGGTDVSLLVGATTAVAIDLGPELCARLTTPDASMSELAEEGSSYTLRSCQVFDNSAPYGQHWKIGASAPGIDKSWVRVESAVSTAKVFCSLSCPR